MSIARFPIAKVFSTERATFAASPVEVVLPSPATNIVPLADQLRSARTVQQGFLPSALPALSDWSISASCLCAEAVGGDFYDVFQLPSGGTMLLVADVMGKGIPAALIASVARTVFRMAVLTAMGPAETFAKVNELLYEDLSNADMFVTAQAAWLQPGAQTLRIVSAGHCPMLVKNTLGPLQSIAPQGIPIGVSPDASFMEASVSMQGVDSVLMFTDGVPDARSPEGETFGQDRLEHWFAQADGRSGGAEHLKEGLQAELEAFQGGTNQFDDQTILVLARK